MMNRYTAAKAPTVKLSTQSSRLSRTENGGGTFTTTGGA